MPLQMFRLERLALRPNNRAEADNKSNLIEIIFGRTGNQMEWNNKNKIDCPVDFYW